MKFKIFLFLLLLPTLIFSKNFRAVNVDVYKVSAPENIPYPIIYPARLKSVSKVLIKARLTGILIKKYFKEGFYVKKGDILYEIEPDIYIATYNLALANLEKAKAIFEKAKNNWIRAKKSYEDKVMSKDKYDSYKFDYLVAKSSVKEAEAKVVQAKINLNYTKVKATISGYTGLKLVDVGNLVESGTSLIEITKVDPIYAEFSVPDRDVKYFKVNNIHSKYKKLFKPLKAILLINGQPYKFQGEINYIDSNIDKNTSTVKIRAIFPNTNKKLMPGQFVRVKITGISIKNVFKIPQKALLQNSRGKMVFVANNGKVGVRFVKIKKSLGDYFIVSKGLKNGDLIIVDNLFKIRPGMPVKIEKIVNK